MTDKIDYNMIENVPNFATVDQVLSATGRVLQMKSMTAFASAPNQDSNDALLNGASFSITPTNAASKLHVTLNLHFLLEDSCEVQLKVFRNGTDLELFDSLVFQQSSLTTAGQGAGRTVCFEDLPNTTSEVTYTVRLTRLYGTGNFLVNQNNYHTAQFREEEVA